MYSTMVFLSLANSCQLFEDMGRTFEILFPVHRTSGSRYATSRTAPIGEVELGGVRTVDPVKAFFFQGRSRVADGFDGIPHADSPRPFCILGAKACDLQGFRILDSVFMDPEYGDPQYRQLRESSLVISCDCTTALETCFCIALGLQPHPTDLFDINLSPVDGGFLAEAGSEKGRAVIVSHPGLFSQPPAGLSEARDAARRSVEDMVGDHVSASGMPSGDSLTGRVMHHYDSGLWAEEASTCVECGACNTICPTCHCFLLYDQKNEKAWSRFRVWDSCLINDFARVAGGANPRERLWMRLRNRFEKKFDFFPKTGGMIACTGCGRCITACPGRIDIRTVLRRLAGD
jgi:formate hydrogenlyase subunit 6/NADH:ubiquinone oxidoreductase subunit I